MQGHPADPADPRPWAAVVYRALVAGSPIPSDPRHIGAATLRAVGRASGAVADLPEDFGRDVERDSAFLTGLVPGGEPGWRVLEDMAWASAVPHTGVQPAETLDRMARLVRGEPVVAPGFVLWQSPAGGMVVADVDEHGSGYAAGLRPGDLVLSVDGRPTGAPGMEMLPFHTAPPGSSKELLVRRDVEPARVSVRLEPGPVGAVTHRLLRDGVGVVVARWFATADDPTRDTAAQFAAALERLRADGARALVLDLRSGLGGSPDAVAGVLSTLCEAETLLTVRSEEGDRVLSRTGPPRWPGVPVAVLVNDQTVSAGEYVALALSELTGAPLVGTPTAGGLTGLRRVDLAGGYRLVLPHGSALGPRSGAPRPGHRLEPDHPVPNPTPAQLRAGADPALAAARVLLGGR